MNTLSSISAFASIIGFLVPYFASSDVPRTSLFQWVCLLIFLIASFVIIYHGIYNRPKSYKNESEIGKYMLNWISQTGRTVIFTRDMSWANSNQIKDKLINKATSNELILCMPEKTEFTDELQMCGAKIYEYSELNYTPESRFTIVHFGRSDAKVAIGRTGKHGKHIITEFENGLHPQFNVAHDLVNIIMKLNK